MTTRGALALALATSLCACASNPNPLNLGSMPVGVTMEDRVHFYDVSAASLAELRRGMAALGPRAHGQSWSAVTQTNFRWTYQYERQGSGCELRRVRVQLRTTVTFPRWNPTAEPDSSLVEWWHQLNTGLMEHERGHARISVETAEAIVKQLEGMSAVGCDALAARATAAGNLLLKTGQDAQSEYDRITRHGATQIERAGRLRSS